MALQTERDARAALQPAKKLSVERDGDADAAEPPLARAEDVDGALDGIRIPRPGQPPAAGVDHEPRPGAGGAPGGCAVCSDDGPLHCRRAREATSFRVSDRHLDRQLRPCCPEPGGETRIDSLALPLFELRRDDPAQRSEGHGKHGSDDCGLPQSRATAG